MLRSLMSPLIEIVLIATTVHAAEPGRVAELQAAEISFEQSYLKIQKKIEALKAKGEKVGDKAVSELDSLLEQMNHRHTQLRRELELKNQQLKEKAQEGMRKEEDWSRRVQGAFQEISRGVERAWKKLKTSDE